MSEFLHEIPPKERLVELEKRLKRVRSIRTLHTRVCEYLQCGGSDVKEFHYKILGHDWKGLIYLKRNTLMGTIFSLWDSKVVIIRGFPKIKYTHDSRVRDQVCIAEEKVDGTCIGVWAFPNGMIMGKTRMVERWDLGAKKRQISVYSLETCPKCTTLKTLLKEEGIPFEEKDLNETENQAELIMHNITAMSVPILQVDKKFYLTDEIFQGNTLLEEHVLQLTATPDANWKVKFEQVPGHEKVYDLARKGFLVFCELYGYLNSGEFVKYTIPIAIKVIGIVDMKRFNFLRREETEKLCILHELPIPKIYFEGKLITKEVERIELDLEKDVVLDGMEGLVAKYWCEEEGDSYFCKLKCEKVKESCYKLSRSLIPSTIIRKAIKKALDENLGEKNIGVLFPIVVEELKEEYDEAILAASEGKVKGLIRYAVTPSDEDLKETVRLAMMDIMSTGIDVEDEKNKGKVLSGLHNRLGDIKGGTLFKLYNELLLEMKGKW